MTSSVRSILPQPRKAGLPSMGANLSFPSPVDGRGAGERAGRRPGAAHPSNLSEERLVYNNPDISLVIPAQNDNLSRTAGLTPPSCLRAAAFALAVSAAGLAGAQTYPPKATNPMNVTLGANYQSGVQFDCNTLYAGTYGATGGVYRIELDQIPPGIQTGAVPMTWVYNQRASTPGWDPGGSSTIALGRPNIQNDPNAPLQMWSWVYTGNADLYFIQEGDKNAWRWGQVPKRPGGAPNYNTYGWSGGEFNQKTGEIVFSPEQGASLTSAYGNFGVFNPITGDMKVSHGLLPASPNDTTTGILSSDMALDALGNIYTLVGGADTKTLVRVKPGEHGQPWYYNAVMTITRNPSGSMSGDNWGMAFLNGKLYFTGAASGSLFEADVFTGKAIQRGTYSNATYDLASCQTAPVIQGTVYNDTLGDGNITPGETPGVQGIQIDLYKEENGVPVHKATHVTGGTGYYSFLLDSTQATYYVRVRQPKIGGNLNAGGINTTGINAAQTWAGAGGVQNPVTAYCVDDAGLTQELTTPGACRGVRQNGSDPAVNDLAQAQIYSKVVMTTDSEVPSVDFALSAAASYGDAPGATFKSPWLEGGPAHALAHKHLWLGHNVAPTPDGAADPAANRNTTDDGVYVILKTINAQGQIVDEEVPLQDVPLATNKTYRIKVKVSGPHHKQGYLNMWDGTAATGTPALKTPTPGNQGLQAQ